MIMDPSSPDRGVAGDQAEHVSCFFDQRRFDGFRIKEGGVKERRRRGLDINKQSQIRLEIAMKAFCVGRW